MGFNDNFDDNSPDDSSENSAGDNPFKPLGSKDPSTQPDPYAMPQPTYNWQGQPHDPYSYQAFGQQAGGYGLPNYGYANPQFGKTYSWLETWQMAVFSPSELTYQSLYMDPNGNHIRIMWWVSIVSVLSSIVSLIVGVLLNTSSFTMRFNSFSSTSSGSFDILFGLISIPLNLVFALISYYIWVGLIYLMAMILGGKAEYGKTAYVFAAIYFPINIIVALLSFIPLLGALASIPVLFYGLVLQVIAIKAINQFGWMKAVIAVFWILIAILGFMCTCGLVFVSALAA